MGFWEDFWRVGNAGSPSILGGVKNPASKPKQQQPKKPVAMGNGPGKVSTYNGGGGGVQSGPSAGGEDGGEDGGGGGGGGGGYDPYAAANAAARSASSKQNDNTRAAAEAKHSLLAAFDAALKTKLGNVSQGLASSDSLLLSNYKTALGGLQGTRADNEKAESDSSFSNISNTLRERGDILAEVASQGAGETDALQAQLAALRNYQSNQTEINRAFHDTQRSVNRSIVGLNTDTITGRKNLYDKAEDDRETAYSNFYNQSADAWNEIFNIENSNTNVNSASSVGYDKKFADAAAKVAEFAGKSYAKKAFDPALRQWEGQGKEEERALTSNKAQVINLGQAQKRPEGATLRKW